MERVRLLLIFTIALSAFAQDDAELTKLRTALERSERSVQNYANLARYAADNAKVQPPAAGEERVVFMGDSITDAWGRSYGKFFPGKPYINRGISGQITAQMLLRFRADVIAHAPKAVVILAGTNDIGGNLGGATDEAIRNNIMSMVDLARANNIKVVLASVLPVSDYIKPQLQRRPIERINAMNAWLKEYTAKNGIVYLDYFTSAADEKGLYKKEITYDGLHPNDAGYEIMMPLAQKAIDAALKAR